MARGDTNDDRFGPNGAVMHAMPPQVRAEHEAAAQRDRERHLPGLIGVGLLMAIGLIGALSASLTGADLSWWTMPAWLWPALIVSLLAPAPVSFVTAVKRRLDGGPFFRFGGERTSPERAARLLPAGVAIAALVDAVQQYVA